MKTTVITTNLDLHGERFAKKCLARLDGVEVPITLNFDIDTEIDKATLNWDGDVIYTEWENEKYNGMYLVPGFYVLERDGNVFKKIVIHTLSLTDDPADTHLTRLGG